MKLEQFHAHTTQLADALREAGKALEGFDLASFREAIETADNIGPFLDPTAWSRAKGSGQLELLRELESWARITRSSSARALELAVQVALNYTGHGRHDLAAVESGARALVRAAEKVYLAGPMTGLRRYNEEAFDSAAAALRGRGYVVESPIDVARSFGVDLDRTLEEQGIALAALVRADLALLVKCDTIALLDGWSASKGTIFELEVARACGLRRAYAVELAR